MCVGLSPGDMAWVRQALESEAVLPAEPELYDEALAAVDKVKPDVVVMGFDPDSHLAIQLGPAMQEALPGVQLVALSHLSGAEQIRAAMRAGYREYVVVPEDADLLRRAVRQAAYSSRTSGERGRVVAFCGTKGGCGVTTLAVNLAAQLASAHRVLAVDMDFGMGDVAAYLDLSPSSSIVDVLDNIQRLDERLLGGCVTVHHSKVHVLAQPHEPVDRDQVSGDLVLRLLHSCAVAYQYVLVDCGVRADEAALITMGGADLVLLVATPDVPSVRNAWRRLKLMEHLGIDHDRIRLVINRWLRAAPISIPDIQANLGMDVAITLANDSRCAIPAVNDGRLLRDVSKRSPLVRDLARMMPLLTENVQKVALVEPRRRSGIFSS